MAKASSGTASYTPFIDKLGAALAALSPNGVFSFPHALRSEAEAVLCAVMTDARELRQYLNAVAEVTKQKGWNEDPFGPDGEERVLDDEVLEHGPEKLSDQDLAATLCSPSLLLLLKKVLVDEDEAGNLGMFWHRAIIAAGEAAFPGSGSQVYERNRTEIESILSRNETTVPSHQVKANPLRSVSRAAAVAVAASLLIALGLAIGRSTAEREVALAARVAGTHDPARGPDTVAGVSVENTSSRTGYVTVVGLSPSRRPAVHYLEQDRFISVGPGQSRTVRSLPTQFDGCPVALVVLTPTPAGEVVRKLSEEPVPPDQAEAFRERLKAGLEELGYRGVGIITVRIEK
ncbi:MAG: hypothetical protein U0804_01245 [Gemmataceae bacterium]